MAGVYLMSDDEIIQLFLFERVGDVGVDIIVSDELRYEVLNPQEHMRMYCLSKLEFESHDRLS